MRLTVLIVAAGLLWPSLSFSQDTYRAFADGNALYSACSSPNKDYCAGYVAAMSDALQREKYVCMPVEVKLASSRCCYELFARSSRTAQLQRNVFRPSSPSTGVPLQVAPRL